LLITSFYKYKLDCQYYKSDFSKKIQPPPTWSQKSISDRLLGFSVGIEAFYLRPWWLVMSMIGSAYAITWRTAACTTHRTVRTP